MSEAESGKFPPDSLAHAFFHFLKNLANMQKKASNINTQRFALVKWQNAVIVRSCVFMQGKFL
jgi:hypothetical protein